MVVRTALKSIPAMNLGIGMMMRRKRKASTHPARCFHGNEVNRLGIGSPSGVGGGSDGGLDGAGIAVEEAALTAAASSPNRLKGESRKIATHQLQ